MTNGLEGAAPLQMLPDSVSGGSGRTSESRQLGVPRASARVSLDLWMLRRAFAWLHPSGGSDRDLRSGGSARHRKSALGRIHARALRRQGGRRRAVGRPCGVHRAADAGALGVVEGFAGERRVGERTGFGRRVAIDFFKKRFELLCAVFAGERRTGVRLACEKLESMDQHRLAVREFASGDAFVEEPFELRAEVDGHRYGAFYQRAGVHAYYVGELGGDNPAGGSRSIWSPVIPSRWTKKPATERRPALTAQSTP